MTNETDDEKHAINARVLEDFVHRLGPTPPDRIDTGEGWITEPVVVCGDDKWLPEKLPVHIAKLITDTRE